MTIICGNCGYKNEGAHPGEFCGACGNELLVKPPTTNTIAKELPKNDEVKYESANNIRLMFVIAGALLMTMVFKTMQSSITSGEFLFDDRKAYAIAGSAVVVVLLYAIILALIVYDLGMNWKKTLCGYSLLHNKYVWADALATIGLIINIQMLTNSVGVMKIANSVQSDDLWGALDNGYGAYQNGLLYYPNGKIVMMLLLFAVAYLITVTKIPSASNNGTRKRPNLKDIGPNLNYITENMAKVSMPKKNNPNSVDIETIQQLKKLVDMGVITEAEFKSRAREIAGIDD